MRMEDMILVSVDDHVIEPGDMYKNHAPAKYKDRLPHTEITETGVEEWVWEGAKNGNLGLNAVVTWPKEEWGFDPVGFEEMRPGCYDIHKRVEDMNVNGIAMSMCFPTYARFSGSFFSAVDDKDLATAAVSAYNDWHIDEWAGAYPDRFIPLAIPCAWDADLSAAEVRRVAKKGCHAVCFTEQPVDLGMPSIHSGYWDPFFKACAEEGTAICIHVGSSGVLPITSPDAPIDIPVTLATMQTMKPMMDFLFSDTFLKFPDLKVALSEGGAGWLPYVLDRLDRHVKNQLWTGHKFHDRVPSDIFRKHFLACVVSDPAGVEMRARIGVENIAIETDYPHSDSQWPNAPEVFWHDFKDVGTPDSEIELMTNGNALRFFGIPSFTDEQRKELTVGALRARSAGVYTGTTTRAAYKQQFQAAAAGV
jgi:predicted TIM-barrel fold metal-dependent hydrolase